MRRVLIKTMCQNEELTGRGYGLESNEKDRGFCPGPGCAECSVDHS